MKDTDAQQILEAYEDAAPYDGMDDQNRRAEDEHQNLLNVRAAFGGKDFIGWAGDKMREIGKEAFEAKWETFIQDLETTAGRDAEETGRILGRHPRSTKWR
tara:strand:- start:47 stop:349 length:303 start_codon:yes stop_codon:yes gene_type:complete